MKLTKKQILTLVDIVTKRVEWLVSLEEPNQPYIQKLEDIEAALLNELQTAPADEVPTARLKKVGKKQR